MFKPIKYSKGKIKEHYGIKYRVYQHSPDAWSWETRKWLVWVTYPHACYGSEEKAEQAARNVVKACAEEKRIF